MKAELNVFGKGNMPPPELHESILREVLRLVKQLADIELETAPTIWDKTRVERSNFTTENYFTEEMVDNGVRLGVLRYLDEVVGTFKLYSSPTSPVTCVISAFIVDEQYRKLGFGEEMLTSALEYIKIFGYQEVIIDYKTNNKAAARFWNKHGFIPSTTVCHKKV